MTASDQDSQGMPHPVDIVLGARLRLLRVGAKMTQDKLGELCGVSFQQILKYEDGVTRVAYSRLTEIAAALGMSVTQVIAPLDSNVRSENDPIELLDQPMAVDVLRAFRLINDTRKRKAALELLRVMKD